MKHAAHIAILFLLSASSAAQDGGIRVHDPVMIRQDGSYYLFCTGRGVSVYSSPDMQEWTRLEPVFSAPPAWAVEAVPGFRGHIWAPDISIRDEVYYLYYSVSAFGKNTSCIGLATNRTLDPGDPDFHWEDHGKVIESVPGRDMWNAIDPNLIVDEEGTPWLAFGSFWNGIKMFRLNDELAAPALPEEWYTLASRRRSSGIAERDPGDGAIEAPFIFRKKGYYYLFVSYDYCCRGLESNYRIMVGRSEKVTGPYLDREGRDMVSGGASQVLAGDGDWAAVGHNAVCNFDGRDYLIFHGYDAADNGRPKLLMRELFWDEEGWPYVPEN